MRILGIDPGSYCTGYGVVDEWAGRLTKVECGTVSPDRKKDFLLRLSEIHEGLVGIISRVVPDEVAVENPFLSRNFKSVLQLGQARAAALLPAAKAGIPVFEYAPRQVKVAVVGHGNAEKSQVARMVTVLLGLGNPPRSLDATDALAVAICHVHHVSGQRKLKIHP